ncbi:unnamed protein product [Absidia cylindrospora]
MTFQADKLVELEHSLCNQSGDLNSKLVECLYQTKMAKMGVQAWLDNALWCLNLRSDLVSNQKQQKQQSLQHLVSKGDDRLRNLHKDDMITLSQVLNTLFSAERSLKSNMSTTISHEEEIDNSTTKNEDQSADQIHTWIHNVGAVYLLYASLVDHKFLLLHLFKSKHATDWGTSLIQYTPGDTNMMDFMKEYILALRCILSNTTDSPWLEEDFINCLDQFDVLCICAQFVDSVSQKAHPLDDAFVTHATEFFDVANNLIDAMIVGIHVASSKQYTNLVKRLAQQISQISITLTSELTKRDARSQQCQSDMDDFILRIVDGLLAASDSNIWHFLPSLPFHVSSISALWEITLKLLQITNYSEPSSLRSAIKTPPALDSFIARLKEFPAHGVFMIGCLTNLVTSIPSGVDVVSSSNKIRSSLGASLVAIIAYTLFTVAFVDPDLDGAYYKDVRDNFGIICAAHPFVISLLLRWTCDHIVGMEKMALYLFRSLPIHQWEILTDDLVLLHQLLRQSELSAWVTFAQYVIGHLNFGYRQEMSTIGTTTSDTPHLSHPWRLKFKQPFLSHETHEQLAFLVLDSCQKYQSLHDFDKNLMTDVDFTLSSTSKSPDKPTSLLFGSSSPSQSKQASSSSSPSPPSVSVAINATSHQNFLDWCWVIIQQLQLYHAPLSSRASDIDKYISLDFLRGCLNQPSDNVASHGALLTYVAFLLSPTSRHFLRFESGHGWMKLLLVLRRGKCTAAMHLLGVIVPAFIYLHGDDFFTGDDSVVDYLRNMVDHKKDPMLQLAAQEYVNLHSTLTGNYRGISGKTNQHHHQQLNGILGLNSLDGIGMIIGSHVWHCRDIDSVSDLNGFSYLNLVLYSWMYTVFRKDDWMWSEQYVKIVDAICYFAYCMEQQPLVFSMLEKEMDRQQQIRSPSPSSKSGSAGSPKLMPLVGQPRKAFKYIKNMLPDTTYATLLTGEWSMLSLTTSNFFKTPGVEPNSLWFAFDVLLLETANEKVDRYNFTQLLLSSASPSPSPTSSSSSSSSPVASISHTPISSIVSSPVATSTLSTAPLAAAFSLLQLQDNDIRTLLAQSKKPVDFYCIYRILQHILVASMDHPVTPLLLQLFFCLYYAHVILETGEGVKSRVFYGAAFFAKKQDQLAKLRDRIASLQTYHGQQGSTLATSASTTTTKNDDQSRQEQLSRSQHHEQLRQVYYAMWLWLGNDDLLKDDEGSATDMLDQLPAHYCPQRLRACFQPTTIDQWETHQPWIKRDALWYELIDTERMKLAFDSFCWVDSNQKHG